MIMIVVLLLSACTTSALLTLTVPEDSPKGPTGQSFNVSCTKYELKADSNQEDLSCCSVTSTGSVSVDKALDREVQDRYTGRLVCSMDVSPFQTIDTVLITISDIDDNVPVFDSTVQYVNISEQAKVNQQFTLQGARDEDTDVNSVQSYTLSDSMFGISTGVLTNNVLPLSLYLKSTLDYETGPHSYNLTITARDTDHASTQLLVIVNVIDENDHKPIFDSIQYTGSVAESAPPHTYIMTVKASDGDSGPNAAIQYSLVKSSFYVPFKVSLSGNITVDGALDREKTAQYTFRVLAEDRGEPALSSDTNVRITVEDANDNKPAIVRPTLDQVISVKEGLPPDTLVTTVQISDLDIGDNAQVSVVVEGVHSDRFQYNYQSTTNFVYGTLTTTIELDREDVEQYLLVLKATDKGSTPLSSKIQFTVVVQDSNDNAPYLDCGTAYTVLENYVGEIGTIQASDVDSGRNAELLYSVQSPSYPGYVTVDKESGQLSVLTSFDAEQVSSIVLLVTVTDNSTSPLSTQCNVTLSITDSNDNQPVFDEEVFTLDVLESVSLYTVIGNITGSDPDSRASLTYSLLTPSPVFVVSEQGGEVRVKSGLDRETVSQYTLRVVISDGLYNSTAELVINILDINDTPPVFLDTPYIVAVSAEAEIGTVLLRPDVTDSDQHSTLTYTINNRLLSVEPTTGALTLAEQLVTPGVTMDQLTVTLTVSDGPHIVSTAVVLKVYSNDGSQPVITLHQGLSVREDCPTGTLVGHCAGTSLYPLSVTLTTYTQYFLIQDSEIRTSQALDYEEYKSYSIECTVTDIHGNSAVKEIVVEVVGVNEFSPVFSKNFYTFTTNIPADNYPIVIGTVIATDRDGGNDGLLKYYLVTNSTVYAINKGTGEVLLNQEPVFTTKRDAQQGNYHSVNLVVGVEDSPTLLSDTLHSTVQITVSLYPVEPSPLIAGQAIAGYAVGAVVLIILIIIIIIFIQRKRRAQRGSKDVTYVNPTAVTQSFKHLTDHSSIKSAGGPYTPDEFSGYQPYDLQLSTYPDLPLSSYNDVAVSQEGISTIVSDYCPEGYIQGLRANSQESVHEFESEGGGEGDAQLDTISLFNKLNVNVLDDGKDVFLGYDSAFSSLHSSSSGAIAYNTDYLHDWRPDFQSVSTVAAIQCKEFAYKQNGSPSLSLPSDLDTSRHSQDHVQSDKGSTYRYNEYDMGEIDPVPGNNNNISNNGYHDNDQNELNGVL